MVVRVRVPLAALVDEKEVAQNEQPLFLFKHKVCLYHIRSIDSSEIITHGDDMIACFAPFLSQFKCLITIGVVTFIIIGDEHKGCSTILCITQAIVMHGAVASTISKRQHRNLTYLLTNLKLPNDSTGILPIS